MRYLTLAETSPKEIVNTIGKGITHHKLSGKCKLKQDTTTHLGMTQIQMLTTKNVGKDIEQQDPHRC
jgi:hypothetical protein